jgi:hypothetical protein
MGGVVVSPETLKLYTLAARQIIADAVAALDEFPGEELTEAELAPDDPGPIGTEPEYQKPGTRLSAADLLAREDIEEHRRA